MRLGKFLACAALFVAITALKLLVPSAAGDLRDALVPAIDKNNDYRAVMTELGQALSSGREVISALDTEKVYIPASPQPDKRPVADYSPKTIGDLHEELSRGVVVAAPIGDPEEPEKTEEPEAQRREDAVATFLNAQSAFAEYELPENVSYEAPALPFSFRCPVDGYTSSGFGYRMHPIAGEVKFHFGTDFAAWTGTEIKAFADGTVLVAGLSDSYGNYIILSHEGGYQTLYAHCSALSVSSGETVSAGDLIGYVGESGLATGPHLHFELIRDDVYMNPEFYLYSA